MNKFFFFNILSFREDGIDDLFRGNYLLVVFQNVFNYEFLNLLFLLEIEDFMIKFESNICLLV